MPYISIDVEHHISVSEFLEECSKSEIEEIKEELIRKEKFNLRNQILAKTLYDEMKMEIIIDLYKNKTLEELEQLKNK